MEPSEELAAAVSQHGELLIDELERLAELPQARLLPGSIFDTAQPLGTVPQLRGVQVRLRCCKKPINVKCNALEGERACHSHVEAARALRAKILKDHSSPACTEKARIALAEEQGEAGSSTAPPADAFVAMARASALNVASQKARVAVTRAEARKSEAEKELSAAVAELAQASLRRPALTPPSRHPHATLMPPSRHAALTPPSRRRHAAVMPPSRRPHAALTPPSR